MTCQPIIHLDITMRKEHIQKGMTIVEMLMYMAIFAILMTVLTQIFTSSLDVQLESKSTSSVQQDGQYMLSRLSYDLKRAQSVSIPANFGQPTGALQISIDGTTYTYSTDLNDNFTITNDQGTNNLNSTGTTVTNVSFLRIGNPGGKSTIQITYQVNSTTQQVSGYKRQTFQTTVSLR